MKYLLKSKLRNFAGVYKISCIKTDKVYIGESIELYKRIQKHFSFLRKNKH